MSDQLKNLERDSLRVDESPATKHTPGPWKAMAIPNGTKHVDRYILGPVRAGSHVYIATVENEMASSRYAYHAPGESAEANARLIAAAPELLDACKFVADKLDDPALVAMLDAAITKAEGK